MIKVVSRSEILDSDDGSESPQDILKRVIAGKYILNKNKNMKGSRAWEKFRITFDPSRD